MCHVQFDHVEPDANGAFRRIYKLLFNGLQPLSGKRMGNRPARSESQRRRRQRRPWIFVWAKWTDTLEGRMRGTFSSGMRELNTQFSDAMRFAEIDHAPECRFVIVTVKAEAAVRNSPFRCNMSRLKYQ